MRSWIAIALIAGVACTVPSGEQTSAQTFGDPTAPGDPPATGSSGPGSESESAPDPSTTMEPAGSSTSDDGDDMGIKLDVGSDTGGPIFGEAEVFGHSGNVLYRMDADTKEVTTVGPFVGCTASIIDIALDADSRMYGTAFGSLWSIDRTTAECTMIATGSYPTSLSFVPAGTVDPVREALVGFVDEEYIRIDTETGEISSLGTLGDDLRSSGDLVSVIDGGSWLTVYGPGCEATDCIIEIDPADGTVLHNYGALPYDQVFGLAFWAGSAYGFARNGALFEIEFDGANVSTTLIPIPTAPADLEFFGAGSTTAAPPAG